MREKGKVGGVHDKFPFSVQKKAILPDCPPQPPEVNLPALLRRVNRQAGLFDLGKFVVHPV